MLRLVSTAVSLLPALGIVLVVGMVATLIAYTSAVRWVVVGALLASVTGTVLFLVLRLLRHLDRYITTRIIPRLKATQQAIVSSLQGQFLGVPVLSVQTRRDEAARYLRLVDLIAGLPFRLWSPTTVSWVTIGATVVYVSFLAGVGFQSEDWRKAWNEAALGLVLAYAVYVLTLVSIVTLVTMLALTACAVWPRVFRAHALGFGEDGFMKNWLVAISASSRPPTADRSRNEMVEVAGVGLRHSLLYQDERAIRLTASWLSAQVEKKSPGA